MVIGGTRLKSSGFFFPPTVITGLPDNAKLMTDEPFGPIAPLVPFTDPEDAIRRANSLPYGLSSYVFTESLKTATYAANAAKAQSALRDLDADLAARLAPVKDKPFVVFHDAIGYFADHYGLTVAGAIELGDASTPGAAQLASIRDLLAASGAVCVFPETGRDPAYIATVAEGSAVRIGAGQDVEGLSLDQGPGQYAALLDALATTLTDCLSAN